MTYLRFYVSRDNVRKLEKNLCVFQQWYRMFIALMCLLLKLLAKKAFVFMRL